MCSTLTKSTCKCPMCINIIKMIQYQIRNTWFHHKKWGSMFTRVKYLIPSQEVGQRVHQSEIPDSITRSGSACSPELNTWFHHKKWVSMFTRVKCITHSKVSEGSDKVLGDVTWFAFPATATQRSIWAWQTDTLLTCILTCLLSQWKTAWSALSAALNGFFIADQMTLLS